jgi:hypothetical protein
MDLADMMDRNLRNLTETIAIWFRQVGPQNRTETSETTSLRKEAIWFRPRARQLALTLHPQLRSAGAALSLRVRYAERNTTMTDDIHDKPKQNLTATEAKPVQERRVSKRIAEAVRLLLTGECKTQKAAALRVDMSETYLSEALRKPHIRVFIAQRVRETIANGTLRASARLVELLDASSEHVSLDASKHLLAIEGIKPAVQPTTSVNLNVQAGYIVDLRTDEEIAAKVPIVDVTPSERDRH